VSGLNLKFEYSDFGMSRKFQQLAARYSDMTPLMDRLGRSIHDQTVARFTSNIGPDGNAWPPSERVLQAQGQAKTLVKSAALKQSLTWEPSARAVQIGTNVIYAAIHQAGGQAGRGLSVTLPARPYLGLSAEDERDNMDIVSDYWDESFAGGAFG